MAPFADETLLFEPAEPLPQALPTVFAFPNTYSVGITSLGYQVVWAMLAAPRTWTSSKPWPPAGANMPVRLTAALAP